MERVYNFSAGPSVLPLPVLQQAQADLVNYKGTGMSVMEMSHRSAPFEAILQDTLERMRRVLKVPENYKIGFFAGGGTGQFAMVPLNLMTTGKADYIVTGNFSGKAAEEAAKYGQVRVVATSKDKNFTYIPDVDAIPYNADSSYVHICQNNTIFGTAFNKLPQPKGLPLVADMSSCILSQPVDVSQYGAMYFGVQKNIAPAGMAGLIIREDLLGKAMDSCPTVMNYQTILKNDSMYNTPNCWSIYITGLVLKWLEEEIGGLEQMEAINRHKAGILYNYLDSQSFFTNPVQKDCRSLMNVTFTTPSQQLDKAFCAQAEEAGLVSLKGHRLVGGMRASIYNAMPTQGVEKLVDFMEKFARANG